MKTVYLDNSSTTPLAGPVFDAMVPWLRGAAGNPASAHAAGRAARRALEDARETTARLLNARPDEVVFTSGATEANNLAVFGLVGPRPGRIVVSPVEHPSVSEPVARLGSSGGETHRLSVDETGRVRCPTAPELSALAPQLVALQLGNHETGAVHPVATLTSRVPLAGTAVHCDAVQVAGKQPIDFRALGVTTLSISAHKFHGPVGVGALLVRRGTELRPVFHGGHQQYARRPGTEPVALAVGLAAALDLAHRDLADRHAKVTRLARQLVDGLSAGAAPVALNGPPLGGETDAGADRLPHVLNLSFIGCRSDMLLMSLDLAGVACSAGATCASGSLTPSPVLRAMSVPDDRVTSAVRFSLSPMLDESDIAEAVDRVTAVVRRLRGGAGRL